MLDLKYIHSIIQKHVEACTREIAGVLTQELTQPLAERFGLSAADIAAVPTGDDAPPDRHRTTRLVYNASTRRWTCPQCLTFTDVRRRAVSAHLRSCTALPPAVPARQLKKKKKKS